RSRSTSAACRRGSSGTTARRRCTGTGRGTACGSAASRRWRRTTATSSSSSWPTAPTHTYTFLVDDGGGGGNVVSRFVLNQSSLQRYVWLQQQQAWSLYWSLPRDPCDGYAQCGAYGVCDASASPMCGCPAGFTPASPREWALRDGSAGCARRTRLNCTGDGFLPLRGVKLPDATNATADASVSLDQCRQRCLANCSCLAYSASSIKGGESGCIMWSSSLIDIRRFESGGQNLFVRLAASDLPSNGDNPSRRNTALAVVLSLSGLLLLGIGVFFLWTKFFRNKER
ncbi:receptor-like serine/threonine-protein kinase SD1-8, partial [Triticum dicoccoides]|uniref:receptor-like serine/threonine-protein kinase SD1-8 n=1 Tax=Triticum dicoccoides TaxID=85692 RepID=UPI00188E938E